MPIDRNSKSLLRLPNVATSVVHVVRELDHLNTRAARAEALDGEDHEGPHAHHPVRRQQRSPCIHPD
jgi:hypothetical protein